MTETYVDIQVNGEGVGATLYEEEMNIVECPNCYDGCARCKMTGERPVADPVVVDDWWASWSELIESQESWQAFSQQVQSDIKNKSRQMEIEQ